jgi:hypothetical protein
MARREASCRRLAASVTDDAAEKVLLALAEKYEALAVECAAREGREKAD